MGLIERIVIIMPHQKFTERDIECLKKITSHQKVYDLGMFSSDFTDNVKSSTPLSI